MASNNEPQSSLPLSKTNSVACLLAYRFSTDPEPLAASVSHTSISGRINVSISAPSTTAEVYCDQIMVALPVGPAATDFSNETPDSSVNTAKWSLESFKIENGSEIGLDDQTSYAVFTFRTRDPKDNLINYNLAFGIFAPTNSAPGTFEYALQENSSLNQDPSTFTKKKAAFPFQKIRQQFYLKNFVSRSSATSNSPTTEFANAAAIYFSWESNGTYFQLFEKNNPHPIYSGDATSFKLDSGLTTSSTFIIAASLTGNPSDDSDAGYEPIYLYEALSVTISNPDLTPKSNSVAGNETIGGTLGVTGHTQMTNANCSGTLGVVGTSTLADANAANLTASGTLHVTETATLNHTIVNGALEATQTAKTGTLTVDGTATATQGIFGSSITAQAGNVSSSGHVLANGTFVSQKCLDQTCAVLKNSSGASTLFCQNYHSDLSNVTGIVSVVATTDNTGFQTNGMIASTSSTSVFTRIPTSNGHRVVTSPLTPNVEVHLNGQGQLSYGETEIEFEKELSEIILHTKELPYRVIITPTDLCNGIAVTAKNRTRFTVTELACGQSNATFDWLLIAAKPADFKSNEPHATPESLPEMQEPVIS